MSNNTRRSRNLCDRNPITVSDKGFGSRVVLVGIQRQHTNHLSVGFVPDGEAVVMIDEAAAVETVSPGVVLQRGVPDRGPKAGHAVPGSRSAGRVGPRHLTLVDGVLPVFDRRPSSSGWIVGQRDVARGEDILGGGALVFV